MRRLEDLQELSELVKNIKFFKDLNLSNNDLCDLMLNCHFQKVDKNENVFDIGDEGETFYIIIRGICSVLIRNPKIRDWYANWI